MSTHTLAECLVLQRPLLLDRWQARLSRKHGADGQRPIPVPRDLLACLLVEIGAVLTADGPQPGLRPHHARAFVSIAGGTAAAGECCLTVFEAGAQVLGAYIVENAGPRAAWPVPQRNRYLGELDAILALLLDHEMEALHALGGGRHGDAFFRYTWSPASIDTLVCSCLHPLRN